MDELYVIGQKVAGGYPEGRYIATKLKGALWDYYIIIGVLDYPSIRAVANPSAWSGAKARKYGEMITVMRDGMANKPQNVPSQQKCTQKSHKKRNES